MVSPHPELERKLKNTRGIATAKKIDLLVNLKSKYPNDYLDIDIYDKLEILKPWDENKLQLPSHSIKNLSLSSLGTVPSVPDKILILCVDFSDKQALLSTNIIRDRFFNDINSLKTYWKEVSYNRYIPDGLIYGWYRAPQPSTYYTNGNYGFGSEPNSSSQLLKDTVNLALNDVDWNFIDANNNGNIEYVFLVHAGPEAAYTGNINNFWASRWGYGMYLPSKNKWIIAFVVSAEYMLTSSSIQIHGIDCHEMGHNFGSLDWYIPPNNIGNFSLMGSGSWKGIPAGNTPVHPDAYTKNLFGFSTPLIDNTGIINILDARIDYRNYLYTTKNYNDYYGTIDDYGCALDEFFLIENRQKSGYDAYLPADGLIIYHIKRSLCQWGSRLYYTFHIEEADGNHDVFAGYNNGVAGDSFKSGNNTHFGKYTNPNTLLHDGITLQDIEIENISSSGQIMTFKATIPCRSMQVIIDVV